MLFYFRKFPKRRLAKVFLFFGVCLVFWINVKTLKAQEWRKHYKIAQYEYQIENYQKAIDHYVQAKDSFLEKYQSKYFRNYVVILKNIGLCYIDCGLYDKAELYLQEVLNIRKQILHAKHPQHAESYAHLATLYRNQSKYDEAEVLYLKAKNLLEQISRKYHPDYASLCQELGVLYENQGFYEKAKGLFLETKRIRRKVLGKKHVLYAEACQNLGRLYWRLGDFFEAETFMIEAKNIIEKQYGKAGVFYAQLCNNLALLYLDQKSWDKAEILLTEAKTIDSLILGTESTSYATICHNLAELYHKKHHYQKAELLYIEAKNIREKVIGKTHYYYALSCNKLGKLYTDQKRFSEAYMLYNEGFEILLERTKYNFSYLSEHEKSVFFNTFRKQFEDYYSFVLLAKDQIPELTAWLYNMITITKGIIFQSSEKIRQSVLESGDSTLIQNYELFKAKREHLAYLHSLPNIEEKKSERKRIEDELNILEKELSKSSSKYSEILNSHKLQSDKLYYWQQIRKKLEPQQIAVELIRTRFQPDIDKNSMDAIVYLALIVTSDTTKYPSLVVLNQGSLLEEQYIKIYKKSINNKTTEDDAIIYRHFWLEIAQKIDSLKNLTKLDTTENTDKITIFLSPDGVYHQINIATLRNPKTELYLMEEIDLQMLGSTRDLLKAKKQQPQTPQDIILMGFPDYNHEAKPQRIGPLIDVEPKKNTIDNQNRMSSFLLINKDIAPLPATKIEIENISKVLIKNQIKHQVFLAKEASELNLKKTSNPHILHIATHGFFNDEILIEEFPNLLSPKPSQKPSNLNTLFSSGLLLASAKKALSEGGDGIFTAYEALNLDLRNTDLVVLSACDTGLGQIVIGEGVYGLQRSFQQAGARSVLMSLWKVEDQATQKFMTQFYKNYFEKKQSKREAFNNTQKLMKQDYKYPYYWGAFILIGE